MEVTRACVGQAVFIRTDTPDYAEETIPFETIQELVQVCGRTYNHMTLDKILVRGEVDGVPTVLTLGFISSGGG